MPDAVNGLPQIAAHPTTPCRAGIYVSSNLSERERMQNQRNGTEPEGLRRPHLPVHLLADPKVVLMTVGFLGLGLDLLVQPLSVAGLALIVLATSPWILQAWTHRAQPITAKVGGPAREIAPRDQIPPRKARQEQTTDSNGRVIGEARPERPPQPTAVRGGQPPEARARQLPLEAGHSELERRPPTLVGAENRASRPRTV